VGVTAPDRGVADVPPLLLNTERHVPTYLGRKVFAGEGTKGVGGIILRGAKSELTPKSGRLVHQRGFAGPFVKVLPKASQTAAGSIHALVTEIFVADARANLPVGPILFIASRTAPDIVLAPAPIEPKAVAVIMTEQFRRYVDDHVATRRAVEQSAARAVAAFQILIAHVRET